MELDSAENKLCILLRDKNKEIPPAEKSFALSITDTVRPIAISDIGKKPIFHTQYTCGGYLTQLDFSIAPHFIFNCKNFNEKLSSYRILWSPLVYSCYSTVYPSDKIDAIHDLIEYRSFSNKLDFIYDIPNH